MRLIIFLFSLFSTTFVAQSSKILVVFPFPARSHHALGNMLVRTLVEAGHDVTFISPFKEQNPPKTGKWTDVLLDDLMEVSKSIIKQTYPNKIIILIIFIYFRTIC